MARRENDLFIGVEHLNADGRNIKHPATIKEFGTINVGKITGAINNLIGLDLETNYLTGELKLIGFWNGKNYRYYTENLLENIIGQFKWAMTHGRCIAYWNRLDPFIIFKQLLYCVTPEERDRSISHFGKVNGEWDSKKKEWSVKPVIDVEMEDGQHFGIIAVIRSSLQFFFYRPGFTEPHTVWAYDIAQLYDGGLEAEASFIIGGTKESPVRRLPYYSKVDESAHLVDWDRFDSDASYRALVLHSNELDARAVYDLGLMVQEEFKRVFGYYPVSLVSAGSLARAAIVATVQNKYIAEFGGEDMKKIKSLVTDDLSSIGIVHYIDEWIDKHGPELVKDYLSLCCETYSGATIEAYAYGFSREAWTVDLASAYPSVIRGLWDLRGASLTTGYGEPPHIPNSYCFIRGTVDIPLECDYHPITVNSPTNLDTNIHAVGIYRASYTINERDYLLESGAKFKDEQWYNLETMGAISPIAYACQQFLDLREQLKKKGDSAEYRAKRSANSLYGLLYEAIDTYDEIERHSSVEIDRIDDANPYRAVLRLFKHKINLSSIKSDLKAAFDTDYNKIMSMWSSNDPRALAPDQIAMELRHSGVIIEEENPVDILIKINTLYRGKDSYSEMIDTTPIDVIRAGYRAGEIFSPILAAQITSEVRIQIAKAARAIKAAGGVPVVAMTDSMTWIGTKEMLPSEMMREKKTVGFFEAPKLVKQFTCLGTGRYSYTDEKGEMTSKRRGLHNAEIHDPQGIVIYDFDWMEALHIAIEKKSENIEIGVRVLVSVGLVETQSQYTFEDLGRVVNDVRTVDLIAGKTKRIFPKMIHDFELLSRCMIETSPIILGFDHNGNLNDQTLPELRRLMQNKTIITAKAKDLTNRNTASKKYIEKNRDTLNTTHRTLYQQLRDYGYTREEAQNMRRWSSANITKKLMEDKKI